MNVMLAVDSFSLGFQGCRIRFGVQCIYGFTFDRGWCLLLFHSNTPSRTQTAQVRRRHEKAHSGLDEARRVRQLPGQ